MKSAHSSLGLAQRRLAATGARHIGNLVSWDLHHVDVDRSAARSLFATEHLGHLIPKMDAATALSRAALEVRRPTGILVRPFARPKGDTSAAVAIYVQNTREGEAGDDYPVASRGPPATPGASGTRVEPENEGVEMFRPGSDAVCTGALRPCSRPSRHGRHANVCPEASRAASRRRCAAASVGAGETVRTSTTAPVHTRIFDGERMEVSDAAKKAAGHDRAAAALEEIDEATVRVAEAGAFASPGTTSRIERWRLGTVKRVRDDANRDGRGGNGQYQPDGPRTGPHWRS